MTDPIIWKIVAAAAVLGLTIVTLGLLRGWHEWIDLQRAALAGRTAVAEPAAASPTARIELADLKERVRKLEAIAAGVDL